MSGRVALLAALCSWLPGCDDRTGIEVTLNARGLEVEARQRVRSLAFSLAGDTREPQLVSVTGLAEEERVLVLTPADTDVKVVVAGFGADESPLGRGEGDVVRVARGERRAQTIPLVGASSAAPMFTRASSSPPIPNMVGRRIAFADVADARLMLVAVNSTDLATGHVFGAPSSSYTQPEFALQALAAPHKQDLTFTIGMLGATPQLMIFDLIGSKRYPWNGASFGPAMDDGVSFGQSVRFAWAGLERRVAVDPAWRASRAATLVLARTGVTNDLVEYDGASGGWVERANGRLSYFVAQTAAVDVVGCAGNGCVPHQAVALAPVGTATAAQIAARPLGSSSVGNGLAASQTPNGMAPAVVIGANLDGIDPPDYVFSDKFTGGLRIALRSSMEPQIVEAITLTDDFEADTLRLAAGDLDGVPGDEVVVLLPTRDEVRILHWNPTGFLEQWSLPIQPGKARLTGVAVDAIFTDGSSKLDIAILRLDASVELWRNGP